MLPWNIHINDDGLHPQSTGCRGSDISHERDDVGIQCTIPYNKDELRRWGEPRCGDKKGSDVRRRRITKKKASELLWYRHAANRNVEETMTLNLRDNGYTTTTRREVPVYEERYTYSDNR